MYLSKSQLTVPEASVVQMMGQFTVQYLEQQACRGLSEGSSCSSFSPAQSSTQFDFLPHPQSSSTKSQLLSNHGRLEKLEKRMQQMESIFSKSLDRINENTLEKMNEKSEQNEFRINKQNAEVTQKIKEAQEQNKKWLKQISDKLEAEMREKEETLRKELAEERQSFQKERESMSLFQQQLIRDKIEMKKQIEEEMTKMIEKEKKEAENIRRQNVSQIIQDVFRQKLREEKTKMQKQIEQVSNFLGGELENIKKTIKQMKFQAQVANNKINDLMQINENKVKYLIIEEEKRQYRELINLARKNPQKFFSPVNPQGVSIKENIIRCLENSDGESIIFLDIKMRKDFIFSFKIKIRQITTIIGLVLTSCKTQQNQQIDIMYISNKRGGHIFNGKKKIQFDPIQWNSQVKAQVDMSKGKVIFSLKNGYSKQTKYQVHDEKLKDLKRQFRPYIYLGGKGNQVSVQIE